jgi:protocatechuate 3,4-dioxygenase beta subunit
MKRFIVIRICLFVFIIATTSIVVIAENTNEPQGDATPGIAVELTDANGKLVTTGYVRTYPNPRPKDWEGDQPRNFELKNGQCFVPLSNFDAQKSFKMVFYADGFTPYERTWRDTNVEKLPKHYVHKLTEQAAEPIGGIVRDEHGKPVEGAEIYFAVSVIGRKNDLNTTSFNTYAQWIKTDSEGRWQYTVLPKEQLDQNFKMSIEHPDYPKLRISEGQLFKDYLAKDVDGRFSKTVTILNGLTLKGIVTDEQNNPVEGVLVYSNAAKRDGVAFYGTTRTNAQGEFLFEKCSPKNELGGSVTIGVTPKNFAPDMIEIKEITAGMEPVKIILKHGKKLVLKMVDKDGKPVTGLKLMHRSWRRRDNLFCRLLENADQYGIIKIGDDGLFIWENATDDDPRFEISGGNKYQNVMVDYNSLKFGGEENIITFLPTINVTGNVADAETGQPIPAFQITEWFSFKGMPNNLTKEFGSQSGKDGKFTRVVGQRFGELDQYYLRVDAEGYEGLMSENILSDAVEPVLNFSLKKAGTFSNCVTGTVLLPDGKPATNTVIGFSTTSYWVQTQSGHLSGCNDQQQTRTDTEGKFSISKTASGIGDQDYMLVFLHDKGQKSIRKEDFEKNSEPIQLEAWSRIEGTVLVGKKPGKNLPVLCSLDPRKMYPREKSAHISHFYSNVFCGENGKFVIDRVFPGKGQIGRAVKIEGSKATAGFLNQQFNLKPGETLQVVLGVEGGYALNGMLYIPDEFESKVDWNFASVTAKRMVPELIALPEQFLFYQIFFEEPRSKPELNTGWQNDAFEVEKIINEWIESPKGKAAIAKDPEGYKNAKLQFDIYSEYDKNRQLAARDCRICQVGENGKFQLDDVTPGLWTLEITLNFPSKPGQWWDYADVWQKKITVQIPQLPDNQTDKPLNIGRITIGFDESERKGAQQ